MLISCSAFKTTSAKKAYENTERYTKFGYGLSTIPDGHSRGLGFSYNVRPVRFLTFRSRLSDYCVRYLELVLC